MNLDQLISLFSKRGVTRLYAKTLSENDNSKNQIYFSGTVEALNAFPSTQVFASNTKQGPTFKAHLNFGWLQESGEVAMAPNAKLILYAQYPEVRFSGFLQGCPAAPGKLLMDRERARKASTQEQKNLIDRVLFIGVTKDQRIIGYLAAGNSAIANQFKHRKLDDAFVVFKSIPLPGNEESFNAKSILIQELRRINKLGWIDSKQLDINGVIKPCNAPQCGGFTLEAELGIPKNSISEPDFLGWEIKQHNVSNFARIAAGTITLMTPEPTGGYYKEQGVEQFVRKFGYPDKLNRPDRLNFGGVHKVGIRHPLTGLTMRTEGYDQTSKKILDATGHVALVSDSGEVAANWAFSGLLKHWSRKHTHAAYIPSQCDTKTHRKYCYGNMIRLATGTDSMKFLHAMSMGEVYYDPGIKMEQASSKPKIKRRSQFRVSSKNIPALYNTVETVEL